MQVAGSAAHFEFRQVISKQVLVTGASGGLGMAIVKRLLHSGHAVVAVTRSTSDPLATLQQCFGERLELLTFDFTNWRDIELWEPLLDPKRCWAGLVNNAAVAVDDLATNLRSDSLEAMFSVNVYTPMMMSKMVIRNMLLHRTAGSLVHVSSICTRSGYKGLSMYAATKGALEAYSKGLAREWGSRGIRSNCVVPGFMTTPMTASLSREQLDKIFRRQSLGRAVEADSVAAVVEFLLGAQAGSVTGQEYVVA